MMWGLLGSVFQMDLFEKRGKSDYLLLLRMIEGLFLMPTEIWTFACLSGLFVYGQTYLIDDSISRAKLIIFGFLKT